MSYVSFVNPNCSFSFSLIFYHPQDSGVNDCLWESNPELPSQHTSLKFLVQQSDAADVAGKGHTFIGE